MNCKHVNIARVTAQTVTSNRVSVDGTETEIIEAVGEDASGNRWRFQYARKRVRGRTLMGSPECFESLDEEEGESS